MKTYLPILTVAKFNKLSKHGKRIAIAKDVIARINAKSFFAKNILFLNFENFQDIKCSLKDVINQEKCEGCAKGALIFSWIGNFNKYNNLDLFDMEISENKYPKELIEIFGKLLLDAIEVCFENAFFDWSEDELSEPSEILVDYFNKFENTDDKLKAIFQNLIDNKGKLKIDKIIID